MNALSRLRRAARASLLPLTLGAVAGACATKGKGPQVAPEAQLLGTELTGETETERFDLNGDGRADLLRVYVLRPAPNEPARQERLLARQEIDLNFDEQVDVRRHFNDQGLVMREEMDLDFDGRFDAVDYYAGGALYRRDMALNFEGRPSIVKYYEDNVLTRKERDTTGSGRMDTFEYYEKGRLTRIGRDNDGDGNPETYVEVRQEVPAGEKPGEEKPPEEKPPEEKPKGDDAKPAETLGAVKRLRARGG
jgi:hypothetical protein